MAIYIIVGTHKKDSSRTSQRRSSVSIRKPSRQLLLEQQ